MSERTRHLLAVDWGTTSLRAALLDPVGTVLERRESRDGLMAMAGRSFPDVLAETIGLWRALHPEAPILLSGMVGSRGGWREAPYLACPAGLADLAAAILPVEAGPLGTVGIVPGLSWEAGRTADVLRGEEVQIFGALGEAGEEAGLLVLPGTHSKWALAEAGRVSHFHTFMTGEVFALLRRHSILARLMPETDGPTDLSAFDEGAAAALDAPSPRLLNQLFSVRALGLFGRIEGQAQPSYLSGLLIGTEIREALAMLGSGRPTDVHLVGRSDLGVLYERCLARLGIGARRSEDAAFSGLHAVASAGGLMA